MPWPLADSPPPGCGIDVDVWASWLGDKTVQLDAALAQSLAHRRVAVAEFLVENGEDINWPNWFKQPPLHYVIMRDRPDMVEWALDHGAGFLDRGRQIAQRTVQGGVEADLDLGGVEATDPGEGQQIVDEHLHALGAVDGDEVHGEAVGLAEPQAGALLGR